MVLTLFAIDKLQKLAKPGKVATGLATCCLFLLEVFFTYLSFWLELALQLLCLIELKPNFHLRSLSFAISIPVHNGTSNLHVPVRTAKWPPCS